MSGFGFDSGSGRVWVPKMSGFYPGFRVFGYPTTSLGVRKGADQAKSQYDFLNYIVFLKEFIQVSLKNITLKNQIENPQPPN